MKSLAEDSLAAFLGYLGYEFKREFKFAAPERQYRADFVVYPKGSADGVSGVLVEIEGVTPEGGRHQRVAGFTEDCRKYNLAAMRGYHVLRFTQAMVKDGTALDTIEKFLQAAVRRKRDESN